VLRLEAELAAAEAKLVGLHEKGDRYDGKGMKRAADEVQRLKAELGSRYGDGHACASPSTPWCFLALLRGWFVRESQNSLAKPDGTRGLLPEWMTDPEAAKLPIVASAALSVARSQASTRLALNDLATRTIPIQAYGARYCARMPLNIVAEGQDGDGRCWVHNFHQRRSESLNR
jgi:hypothetical protein